METQANGFLATEKINRLIRKFAIPCVVSLLIGAVYNITDQIFVGHGVGLLGNGATNVVFPLTVAALALATMIGDGACTFVSLSLGRGDEETAGRTVGNAIALTVASSVLLTALYISFSDSFLHMFGATEANLPYAREYFRYITLGVPFYMFGQAMNPVIRSDGNPRFAMISTVVGAAVNVVLDPIFIFDWGLGMGMKGAAIATVAGQVVTAVLAAWYACRMKAVRLHMHSFLPQAKTIWKIVSLGFCSFLSQISLVVAFAFTNTMIVKYGAMSVYGEDIPLTVIGIVCKFLQIVIAISIGLSAGCIPIVGYNYGAKLYERARQVMWRLLACEAVVGVIALCLFMLIPRQLIGIFGSESDLYNEFAVMTFRTYLSMIALACINKGTFIFMQSLGKPVLSTGLSLLREVVLAVPLVMILPKFYGLNGVLYSMPVADIITFVASAAIILVINRQLMNKNQA